MNNVVTVEKLADYVDKEFNVLLIGKKGVGKSHLVIEAFKKAGLQDDEWLYFSASTLDPWVDFVGIPKECEDPITKEKYIDVIRPKHFKNNKIKAIFLDEYSRAPVKIKNAVMELIQFKSINGKKFDNLKVVWAAINPADDDDESYDVSDLDPAQKDRFHIHLNVEYKPNRAFFAEKYGLSLAQIACNWWDSLNNADKLKVSPRRLDYALQVWGTFSGANLEDVLPYSSNFKKLEDALKNVSKVDELREMYTAKDYARAKVWVNNSNNYESVKKEIIGNPDFLDFYVPIMPEETISQLINDEMRVQNFALAAYTRFPSLRKAMTAIKDAGVNAQLSRKINHEFDKESRMKGIKLSARPKVKADHAPFSVAGEMDENGSFTEKFKKENPNMSEVIRAVKAKAELPDNFETRKDIWVSIKTNMSSKISKEHAVGILDIIEKVISNNENVATLNAVMIDFVGVINNVCHNLFEQKYDFSNFPATYPKTCWYIAQKKNFYFELE